MPHRMANQGSSSGLSNDVEPPSIPGIYPNPTPTGSPHLAHWRSRLNTLKNSFLGSPRFHRRKLQASNEDVHYTPESSPELTKRSWFGSLIGSATDEAYTILVRGKPLATVKADLIHAFLSVAELSHSVASPMSFKVEYKRGSTGPAMFQRQVRFQVDISPVPKPPGHPTSSEREFLYAITFILLSGNIRRFRRICEHIQSQVCSRRPPPPSPRASRKFGNSEQLSESSSCGSDTSDRLSPFSTAPSRQIESDKESDFGDVKIPTKDIRGSVSENSSAASLLLSDLNCVKPGGHGHHQRVNSLSVTSTKQHNGNGSASSSNGNKTKELNLSCAIKPTTNGTSSGYSTASTNSSPPIPTKKEQIV